MQKDVSPAVITEAAAWVARLHGPLRTPAVETGFRAWLAESAEHARAFELVTNSWDEVGALRSAADIKVILPSDRVKARPRGRLGPSALAAAVGAIVIMAALYILRPAPGVATGIGEQRLLTLDDGSRVYLNTATHVLVEYDEKQRRVRLESGEALFEVAQRPNRPFIVSAGDRDIVALGTSFVVRREAQRVAVTLVEGKVVVKDVTPVVPSIGTTVLAPGERITFDERRASARKDRPALEKVTAWQRGNIPIDDLPLVDAVAEMNRYSKVPLAIERMEAQQLRVSGIFRAGDSLSFAKAVSANYGLRVEEADQRIVIAGLPQ